jgi:hypothetical protein
MYLKILVIFLVHSIDKTNELFITPQFIRKKCAKDFFSEIALQPKRSDAI